jgi:hypothetical protein
MNILPMHTHLFVEYGVFVFSSFVFSLLFIYANWSEYLGYQEAQCIAVYLFILYQNILVHFNDGSAALHIPIHSYQML